MKYTRLSCKRMYDVEKVNNEPLQSLNVNSLMWYNYKLRCLRRSYAILIDVCVFVSECVRVCVH